MSAPYALGSTPGARPIQTFSSEADRIRLTPSALAGLLRLVRAWGVNGTDAAALIGVSASTWDRIARGRWQGPLSQDQMTRVSALVGIYKGLHLLFVGEMADRWPTLRNRGPLFGGQTPVEAMKDGGIPTMLETRRYVDALRGGL